MKQRAEEIFAEALELDGEERLAFLDQACDGNPKLRADIDALLEAYDASDSFLEQSAVARPKPAFDLKSGETVGPFTLIRKLGDGGCGVVYLANQEKPVRRNVALKVIKAGMDTELVIRRFEGERQALAIMDHPDIAHVFDAGTTDAGRPWFAMEFVDGIPITQFCDKHELSLAERLELFARVCVAVQHAHQKGIIHRDIKPSNILVTWRDGAPAPKVIDFGIAKATQERLTEQTLVTRMDQFIGTPAYMSPEQAGWNEGDIDTRSDVYSLGVLLYELLTGGQPYDAKTLAEGGPDEIRRLICVVMPPRPTQRFTKKSLEEQEKLAKNRRASPSQIATTLKGDLEWIVMRCLEKERNRRYSSAQDLADDLRRYLRKEPVEARPPSRIYLAQKFIARNKLACASAASIALALILGTIVSVNQAIRATQAERVALMERDAAEAARADEALARADAQRRQEQAEDLLTFMLGDFRQELEKIGRLSLLDAVGEKVMEYFASLDPRDLTDSSLAQQARALTQIGEVRMSEARFVEAEEAFAAALDRAAALSARYPDNGDMLYERAQAEFWIGFVARQRGQMDRFYEWLQRYRNSAIELVATEGNTRRAQLEVVYGYHNLAVFDLERGHLDAAREEFLDSRRTLEAMLAKEPEDTQLLSHLADNDSWLGSIAERQGRFEEAVGHYMKSVATYRSLSEQNPQNPGWRWWIGTTLGHAADASLWGGQLNKAADLYTQTISIQSELSKMDSDNKGWKVGYLLNTLRYHQLSLLAPSLTPLQFSIHESIDSLERLMKEEPSARNHIANLAYAWRLEALKQSSQDTITALNAVKRATELNASILTGERLNHRTLYEFAQSLLLSGWLHHQLGDTASARSDWERIVDTLLPQVERIPEWRIYDPLAQALTLLGREVEALPYWKQLQAIGYTPIHSLAASPLELVSAPTGTSNQP